MINKKDIDKEVKLTGIVESIKKPYIRIVSARFECKSCGACLTVFQEDKKIKQPACMCGKRTGFKLIEKEEIEGQNIYVLEKGTEFGYMVYLEKEKLIRILTKINEGCSVRVKGIVKVYYKKNTTIGDLVILATNLEKIIKKK